MVLYYGQKIEKKYYPVTVYKYRGNFIKGHQQHYYCWCPFFFRKYLMYSYPKLFLSFFLLSFLLTL